MEHCKQTWLLTISQRTDNVRCDIVCDAAFSTLYSEPALPQQLLEYPLKIFQCFFFSCTTKKVKTQTTSKTIFLCFVCITAGIATETIRQTFWRHITGSNRNRQTTNLPALEQIFLDTFFAMQTSSIMYPLALVWPSSAIVQTRFLFQTNTDIIFLITAIDK